MKPLQSNTKVPFLYYHDKFEYQVNYSKRRRTLAIVVSRIGIVKVKVPYFISMDKIKKFIDKHHEWVSKTIKKMEQKNLLYQSPRFSVDEPILYLGDEYFIQKAVVSDLNKDCGVSITIDNKNISLGNEAKEIYKNLQKLFIEKSNICFNQRLKECYDHFKKIADYNSNQPNLTVKCLKSKWGSMHSFKGMTLNAFLIQMSLVCIDYVIFHELCHLRYRNHGLRFYNLFNKVMPAQNEVRKMLISYQKRKNFIVGTLNQIEANQMEPGFID